MAIYEIMEKDRVITRLVWDETLQIFHAEIFNTSVFQPFRTKTVTKQQFNEWLESRCFDRNRGDASKLLAALGIDAYDPYAIIAKTHGVMSHDFIWLQNAGEALTWREVDAYRDFR